MNMFVIMKSKYDLVKSYYINNFIPLGKYFSWVHLIFYIIFNSTLQNFIIQLKDRGARLKVTNI
jgi:hypothetical protein